MLLLLMCMCYIPYCSLLCVPNAHNMSACYNKFEMKTSNAHEPAVCFTGHLSMRCKSGQRSLIKLLSHCNQDQNVWDMPDHGVARATGAGKDG